MSFFPARKYERPPAQAPPSYPAYQRKPYSGPSKYSGASYPRKAYTPYSKPAYPSYPKTSYPRKKQAKKATDELPDVNNSEDEDTWPDTEGEDDFTDAGVEELLRRLDALLENSVATLKSLKRLEQAAGLDSTPESLKESTKTP